MVAGVGDGRLVLLDCDIAHGRWIETHMPGNEGVWLCSHSPAPGLVVTGSTAGTVAAWSCEQQACEWRLQTCHQSAVTTLWGVQLADRLLVVTGGDDQGLTVVIDGATTCVASNAHASAVKGVWSDGRLVLSVGLDQRLRVWRLEDGALVLVQWHWVQVLEPEGLHVCEGGGGLHVAVCGRGVDYFLVKLL